jgi:hypothetical protein
MDEQVYEKEDEVDGLKNVLKNKDDPSQILEDEATGPDVMEVSYVLVWWKTDHVKCCSSAAHLYMILSYTVHYA